jgi:hypothetical protein
MSMSSIFERSACDDACNRPGRRGQIVPAISWSLTGATRKVRPLIRSFVFAGAGVAMALAQIADAGQTAATPAKPNPHAAASTYRTTALTGKARSHYQIFWGIDSLEVKAVESGEMIRFSYFVLDAGKATQLNDKKANPTLVDQEARVTLSIPSVEQVGQLRQSGTPVSGKAYWMVFANKRREVKRGDRVSIVIGKFRADGLYVQ